MISFLRTSLSKLKAEDHRLKTIEGRRDGESGGVGVAGECKRMCKSKSRSKKQEGEEEGKRLTVARRCGWMEEEVCAACCCGCVFFPNRMNGAAGR